MQSPQLFNVELPAEVTRQAVETVSWQRLADQPLQDNTNIRVEIRSDQTYRQWEGFGGAVSELGWQALAALDKTQREPFFQRLFGADGAGFNWIRLPVGASDFARDEYSFSETPEDYELAHFTIERDRQALIPFIQAAKSANPDLRIHASPWSPPGWMKHSGAMAGQENSELRDEPRVLTAYALYLRKFIEAYADEGIHIDRLMVQNEMDSQAPFPGCRWTPELFVRFHLDYLKPEFERHGIQTEIWAGTFRTMTGLQAHDCFANSAFRKSVAGAAFQYSFPDALTDLQLLYPGTRIMHTESACHSGRNTTAEAVGQFDDVIAYAQAGASVFTYWNMVLDQNRTSTWGWPQNSLCTVNTETGQLVFNPDFEIFQLLGKAIRPGAMRIRAFSYLARTACFRNPDGSFVLLLRNLEGPRQAEITLDGATQTVELPGHAVCCVRLR
ncbi:MAG: glycoside hydrolase family 30 protein [Verrucomicrobiota bacterium]